MIAWQSKKTRLPDVAVACDPMISDSDFLSMFRDRVRAQPTRVFAYFEGDPLTFQSLDNASEAIAHTLMARGEPGEIRVATAVRNGPTALAIILAVAKAGGVWIPINVQARGDSLRHILTDSAPTILIVEDDWWQDARSNLISTCLHRGVTIGVAEIAKLAAPVEFQAQPKSGAQPRPDDVFAIMYTSGTTGKPKGVLVTHRMLRIAGEGAAIVSGASDGDVMFMWEPLYHIGGAQMMVLPVIREVHLAMVERFSASAFWQRVSECGATHIHYLGGILQMLLRQPPSAAEREHKVRVAWGGGCPPDVWRAVERRFGVAVRECYGMTEASSITTCNINGPVGSVGRPLPWFELDVVTPSGATLRASERGEIRVRSRVPGALFPGYRNDSDGTSRVLRDGALYTGDIGSLDPRGHLYFHGRANDSVRCRGENVSAWEVEHVAAAHPAVEDCAMIGVPADVGESEIKLFVKPRAESTIDPYELSSWLEARLAPYQNPRYIAIVSDFERTASQRIMKHLLSTETNGCFDRTKPVKGAL